MSDGSVVLKIEGDDSALREVLSGMGALGQEAGMNTALGVAAGIAAGTGAAVSAAQKLAQQVAAALRNELGIRSPSKVAEEIAMHFDAGLVKGLLGGADDVTGAAHTITAGILSAAQAGLNALGALPAVPAGAAAASEMESARRYGGTEQRIVIDFLPGSDAKRLFYAYAEEGERLSG